MNLLDIVFTNIIAVTVSLPGDDLTSSTSGGTVVYDKTSIFDIIKLINEYVWFFLFFVAMGVIIRGGIQLFLSEGDAGILKKANMTIVYGLIGIVISVSSYFVIKLLVNLF